MKKPLTTFLLLLSVCSCLASAEKEEQLPFAVRHVGTETKPLADPPFFTMCYYRTEVENTSEKPLRIIWFQVFFKVNGEWIPNNVAKRTLRAKDFDAWYTEGYKTTNGLIPPGKVAVCDSNWHGVGSGIPPLVKWEFIAVDGKGRDYHIKAIVDPKVVTTVKTGVNKPE